MLLNLIYLLSALVAVGLLLLTEGGIERCFVIRLPFREAEVEHLPKGIVCLSHVECCGGLSRHAEWYGK